MKKIALSLFVIAASAAYVLAQSGAEPAKDVLGAALPTDDAPTHSLASRAIVAADDGQAAAASAVKQSLPSSVALAPSRSENNDPPVTGSVVTPAEAGAKEASPPPARGPSLTELPAKQPAADPGPAEAAANPPPVPPAPVAPALAIVNVPLPRPRPEYRVTQASAMRAIVTVAAGSGYTDGTYTGPTVDAYYGLVQVQAMVQSGRLAAIKVLRYPSDRRTSVFINRQALPMLRDEVIRAQSAKVDIISGATLTSKAFIRSLDNALRQATA
jgi:uncharacterized protein with FMN-binding domain